MLNTLSACGKFPLCLTGNISNSMVDWIGMGHSLPFNPHLQQKQAHYGGYIVLAPGIE